MRAYRALCNEQDLNASIAGLAQLGETPDEILKIIGTVARP